MLIEYIKIENWRSFYGENEIWISTDPDKNVTLIRAENGVGKTSLLAAINWCFFGILPSESEFENPKKLVNEFAVEHDKVNFTTVEIDFLHEGTTYRASRRYEQRTETMQPLRLSEIFDGGEVPTSVDRSDRFINSVIPREMAPHFFFYGEATSRYTGASGAKKFGEAVKGILGSTVARMALSDLRKAFKDYNREAADNTGAEAKDAENQIESIETKIAQSQERLKKCDEEIEAAETRLDRLSQELAGTKPAKEAQERRARLEAQLAAKESEKSQALQRAEKWMQNSIIAVLAEELVAEAGLVIKEEDTRGKLPAPYDKKFVDEIIEDGLCICGRPVDIGSEEHERIKSLLETAGDQVVMSRVMTTNTALGTLVEKAKHAWTDFERNNEDLRKVEASIARLDADLVEISKELAANPITDIAEKEAARSRAKSQRSKAIDSKSDIKAAITNFDRQKAAQVSRLNELTRKSEAARRYVKRAQLAAALTARLEGRLKAEEETARAAIESEIDAIVQKFMRKSAHVKLDKNYQLNLHDERSFELAKSTGENQLLGLAFTGAIAKYAKERDNDENDILLPGTVAPLVVDSPFGHLDPIYRRGVAEFLPNLASQVILLVSTSQASEAVMTTLADKIGIEYILTRHNRSDGSGKQPESIEISGTTYDLTTYNSEIEGTRIGEVSK
jgi:DNA sulfur modification protein DndD